MKIVKWLKKDWLGLVLDITVLSSVMIIDFNIETLLLLIAYVIVSTIIHYDRYKKNS